MVIYWWRSTREINGEEQREEEENEHTLMPTLFKKPISMGSLPKSAILQDHFRET